YNIAPTVITRHWQGTELSWAELISEDRRFPTRETFDPFDVIRLPYIPKRLLAREQFPWIIPILYKSFFVWQHFRGNFQLELDAWICFRQKVLEELNTGKYHALIVVVPPHNLTPLLTEVSQKYRIHTVLDFQEEWKPTTDATQPRQKWELKNYQSYYKRWIKPIKEIWFGNEKLQSLLSTQKQILHLNPCIEPEDCSDEVAKAFAQQLADRIHANWELKK
ncbi:MAG: hypothetical protein NZ108_00315, partial [Bacteroidia bacterium]|nr:hypothetical protein [Bacteroidia bacterium]